jgi:hypothetical protein
MPKSREEIKAQVMAELEAVVDQVLSEAEQGQAETITGIEDIVLQARSDISQQLTDALVAQVSQPVLPGPRCGKCGQEMHYKGMKRRYVRTRSGEIQIERAYYHCSRCQQGSFPPG